MSEFFDEEGEILASLSRQERIERLAQERRLRASEKRAAIDWADVGKWNEKRMRKELNYLRAGFRGRLFNIEREGLYSEALNAFIEKRAQDFTLRGTSGPLYGIEELGDVKAYDYTPRKASEMTLNQMREEFVALQQFFSLKTATLEGARADTHRLTDVFTDLTGKTPDEQDKTAFWRLFNRFKALGGRAELFSGEALPFVQELLNQVKKNGASVDLDTLVKGAWTEFESGKDAKAIREAVEEGTGIAYLFGRGDDARREVLRRATGGEYG